MTTSAADTVPGGRNAPGSLPSHAVVLALPGKPDCRGLEARRSPRAEATPMAQLMLSVIGAFAEFKQGSGQITTGVWILVPKCHGRESVGIY